MAEAYRVALRIIVTKAKNEEEIVNEENFFPDITFPRMASISDQFYDLIAKLKK